MVRNRDEVIRAALSLSAEDRAEIVERLLPTLENRREILDAWLEVAEERFAEYQRGEGVNHDGAEVIERLSRGERP